MAQQKAKSKSEVTQLYCIGVEDDPVVYANLEMVCVISCIDLQGCKCYWISAIYWTTCPVWSSVTL